MSEGLAKGWLKLLVGSPFVGAGIRPWIFSAIRSIRLAGMMFPTKGSRTVLPGTWDPGSYIEFSKIGRPKVSVPSTLPVNAELKFPVRNAAVGTVGVAVFTWFLWRKLSVLNKKKVLSLPL